MAVWIGLGRADAASLSLVDPLPGHMTSSIWGVSADGRVAVGSSYDFSPDNSIGIRYLAELGTRALGSPAAEHLVIGFAASGDGSVIVGQGPNGEALRWVEAGRIDTLGTVAGKQYYSAFGVSLDGGVIVGSAADDANETGAVPVAWSSALVGRKLGLLSGSSSGEAMAVSGDGKVVVGNSGDEAFRLGTDGVVRRLGHLPGAVASVAQAVSQDGSVIAGYSMRPDDWLGRPFRWSAAGGMESLGDLGGEALAVSADGGVIVGGVVFNGDEHAFIWDATKGMRLLRDVLAGDLGIEVGELHMSVASGISADGKTIVGNARLPNGGGYRGWVLRMSESAPELRFSVEGGLVTIRWSAELSRNHLLHATSLIGGGWTAVSESPVVSGTDLVMRIEAVGANRYFMLRPR